MNDLIQKTDAFLDKTGTGIDHIYSYDNIAITVLVVCLLLAIGGNFVQYWSGNRRQDKDFDRYLAIINAMASLEGAIDQMTTTFNVIREIKKGEGP